MIKKILLATGVFILSLLISELVFRLAGKTPHIKRNYTFYSEPINCYLPDSTLGNILGEGSFKAVVNEKLVYYTNHVRTGGQVTRRIYNCGPDSSLPRLDFHGCSFTYGMGVNDSQTYAALFAGENLSYRVRNCACPGYLTLEALLVLERQKEQNDLPETVVLNYLDFHDQRNAGTAEWRQAQQEGFMNGASRCLSKGQVQNISLCRFPFAGFSNRALDVKWFNIAGMYHQFWGREKSAFIYALEQAVNKISYSGPSPQLITKAVFLEIQKFCLVNKIKLIVTTMSAGENTNEMQRFFTDNHIEWIDIAVDFSNPVYTNFPYDGHPSPLAHRWFANKLKASAFLH